MPIILVRSKRSCVLMLVLISNLTWIKIDVDVRWRAFSVRLLLLLVTPLIDVVIEVCIFKVCLRILRYFLVIRIVCVTCGVKELLPALVVRILCSVIAT